MCISSWIAEITKYDPIKKAKTFLSLGHFNLNQKNIKASLAMWLCVTLEKHSSMDL